MVKYRYNDNDDIAGDVCTVLYCAPHTNCDHRMLYLIKHEGKHYGNYVYLIDEAGIEVASRKMTLADIEKELGYSVEIVEE